jgi:integrase
MARGSIRRRGSTWTVILDVGRDPATGKRRQRWKGGYKTRKAAEAALRELMAEVDQGNYVARSSVTVADYLTGWLETVRPRLRPTTWNSYRIAAARVARSLGNTLVQSLTPLEVERFYADLLAGAEETRPLSPKTVRNTHIVLRKALADAERLGLVPRNPAASAKAPTASAPDHKTWTADQLASFLRSIAGTRLEAAFVVLATTGMRRGEVLGLRWPDVDLPAARLAVVQTVTTVSDKIVVTPPKTPRSRRSVSLDPVTVAALEQRRLAQKRERLAAGELWSDEGWVFGDEIGRPLHPNSLTRLFETSAAKAALPPIRLHDLRHTYATLALSAGVHPKIVSERLGHATVGITLDLYSHVTPTLDGEAASLVASHIFGDRDLPAS